METITLEVEPKIAEAYQFASPEERRQIIEMVTLLLKRESENDIDFLRKIMDNISDIEESRGLTPEILESIITGFKQA